MMSAMHKSKRSTNNGAKTIRTEGNQIKQIIDPETGEIVEQLYPGDKIVRGSQSKYHQENKCGFAKGKRFAKIFPETISCLFGKLKPNEVLFAFRLITYLDYDCSLKYKRDYLTMQSMATLTGASYSTIRKIISRLIYGEVLAKRSDIYGKGNIGYVMNPYIACKGADIPIEVYRLFRFSAWSWQS